MSTNILKRDGYIYMQIKRTQVNSEGERKALPTYSGDVEIVGSAAYRVTGVNDSHITIG